MADPFDLNENIIARLGLQDLPEEKRLSLLEDLGVLVQKRVTIRLMEALPDEDVQEADRLSGDPEALLAFLSSKVADVGTIIEEETEKVKEEMLAAADEDAPLED